MVSLSKIEKYTQDASDIIRENYLAHVWKFSDLHKPEAAPQFIHRIKDNEIKHMGSVGEHLLIVNNQDNNVDVYATDQPHILKQLDLNGTQMNCS